ncbi:MAG: hypothetical protein B7733_23660 [Myxococcales bacterium FL481]|nr:MAG: hypothetical protein B7733_23660 [Myxococcales bacterium FL481]
MSWPRFRTLACFGVVGLFLGCVVYVDDSCDAVQCGENAYCDEGECFCVGGFDGDPQVSCDPVQSWFVTDFCDDGLDVSWRLFAEGRDWAWPRDGSFVTSGVNAVDREDIVCLEDEIICIGATAGDVSWGVANDGSLGCTDCCFACVSGTVDFGKLSCAR